MSAAKVTLGYDARQYVTFTLSDLTAEEREGLESGDDGAVEILRALDRADRLDWDNAEHSTGESDYFSDCSDVIDVEEVED